MAQLSKILIIEDDTGVALALYRGLGTSYKVITAKTGSSGLRKARASNFEAIILDLSLPDVTGLDVCRQLRIDGVAIPIIVLTGEGRVSSKIDLLDAGANDYITKPFSLEELKARLRGLLRHVNAKRNTDKLVADGLVLDRLEHRVEREGQYIISPCGVKNSRFWNV